MVPVVENPVSLGLRRFTMFSIMFIHVLFVRKVRAISSGNSINLDSTANIELLSYYVPKSFGNLRFYRIMWNMGLSSPAIGGPTLGSSDCCVATPAAVLTPFLRHGTRPFLWPRCFLSWKMMCHKASQFFSRAKSTRGPRSKVPSGVADGCSADW